MEFLFNFEKQGLNDDIGDCSTEESLSVEESVSSLNTFISMVPIIPEMRTGKHRPYVIDKWGNASTDVIFECGTRIFDEWLDEPVECRVFVESKVVTFQSIRKGENDNHHDITNVKLYMFREKCYWNEYIAMGVFLTKKGFTLVINGFLINFIETEDYGVDVIEGHVDPKLLPQDLKLKIIPQRAARTIMYWARAAMKRYLPAVTFPGCYKLANCIVENVSFYLLELKVEKSKVPGEPCYKSIKLSRTESGRDKLWKKF
jgi:hypothetical protein